MVESNADSRRQEQVPAAQVGVLKILGTRVTRLDTPPKVDGSAQFGIDVVLPDMLVAVVARCPVFGGTVASFARDLDHLAHAGNGLRPGRASGNDFTSPCLVDIPDPAAPGSSIQVLLPGASYGTGTASHWGRHSLVIYYASCAWDADVGAIAVQGPANAVVAAATPSGRPGRVTSI